MQTVKEATKSVAGTQSGNATAEPIIFRKRFGSTTFRVAVYFNPNAKETAADKIMRLIRSEAACGVNVSDIGKAVNQ